MNDFQAKSEKVISLEKHLQEKGSYYDEKAAEFQRLLNSAHTEIFSQIPGFKERMAELESEVEKQNEIGNAKEEVDALQRESDKLEEKIRDLHSERENREFKVQKLERAKLKHEELSCEIKAVKAKLTESKGGSDPLDDSGNETMFVGRDDHSTGSGPFGHLQRTPIKSGNKDDSFGSHTISGTYASIRQRNQELDEPMETGGHDDTIIPPGYDKAQSTPAAMTSLAGLVKTNEVSKLMLSSAAPPPVTPIPMKAALVGNARRTPGRFCLISNDSKLVLFDLYTIKVFWQITVSFYSAAVKKTPPPRVKKSPLVVLEHNESPKEFQKRLDRENSQSQEKG